jgi:NADH-quinone oxidoreductase subunit L
MAALIGLKQNDIKKVLAYSTVSQLGLMFVALGCGAYTAAMFHLATHAFFKALLFLGSGSVIHAMHHEQDIRQMGGLKSKMPITYITFLIGTLAITGFPFLSGFFSKDEILLAAFEHNKVVYVLSVISATITGLYMFRMFFVTFHGTYRNHHHSFDKVHESPWQMSLPLMILAVLSVLGGLLNLPSYLGHNVSMKLSHWLAPILPMAESHAEMNHNTEFMLVGLVVLLFVLVVLYTRNKYVSKNAVPEEDALTPSTGKVLANKFYVDELYDMVFVKPLELLSSLVDNIIDSKLIGGLIAGVSTLLVAISGLNKKIQNGNIEYYLTFMVLALALFLGFNLFF